VELVGVDDAELPTSLMSPQVEARSSFTAFGIANFIGFFRFATIGTIGPRAALP
jgi:hypothetical protein